MTHYAVIERDTQRIMLVFGSTGAPARALADAATLIGSIDVGALKFNSNYYSLNPKYIVRRLSDAPR